MAPGARPATHALDTLEAPYTASATRWGLDGGYVPPPPTPAPSAPGLGAAHALSGTPEHEPTAEEANFETIVFRVFD